LKDKVKGNQSKAYGLLSEGPMKLIRKTYTTRPEKTIDFIVGFVGWFVIHTLYHGLTYFISEQMGEYGEVLTPCLCLPLPVTILALILLSRTRYWIASGALSAVAVNAIGYILTEPGNLVFSVAMCYPFFLDWLVFW
jgi:hypothetical protein